MILKLWASEGQFSYHGKFFHVTAPDMDPVKERGFHEAVSKTASAYRCSGDVTGLGSIRLAGERGWIPMSSSLLAPHHLKDHWRLVEAGAASAGPCGRPPAVAHWPRYFRGGNVSPGA